MLILFLLKFVNLQLTKSTTLCGCIYKPPSMSLLVFNDLLTKMFNKIQGDNKYITTLLEILM